ncbi:hypothetical protein SCALIN_C28_0152 [Candidatus Scalindua japonica]|uniref:Uncharacterized protein n=1 Tax=Candidatus Scalindua japonica TaxID=1284222 RepID=A0A286U1B9_9BACT|nr:hypothetical protein [Candidatus Scalindua japonica]GAX61950.1 hypothetical protein SCALIN_C28_0152 [Candidatus Scalindua japonica]
MNNVDLMRDTNISTICEKLKQDGFQFKDEKFDYLDVRIAFGQQFKMSWLKTTQVNIFAIMGIVEKISGEFVEAYSRMALSYAMKNHKLFPKQMHNITASFPLLISTYIDNDAKQWVQQQYKSQLGFHEIPVILDSGNNTLLHCDKSKLSSGIKKFLAGLIQKYFNTVNI